MAAPVELGHGLGEQEHAAAAVGVDDVKRQAPTEDPAGDGSEVGVEDEQVAKKPRVEKAENGAADKEAVDGDVEEEEEEEEETVEELNGAKAEEENGAGEVEYPAYEEEDDEEEEEGEEEAKDAAPGDGGLRTLLQEGEDAKKSAVAKHGADAAHMLNGAK